MHKTPILSVHKLSLKAQSSNRLILNDVTFDVYPQDFLILLGSNGSGKSSLIKTILNPSHKTSGTIAIDSKHSNVKAINQNTHLNIFENLSVYENFRVYNASIKHFFKSASISKKEVQAYLADFNEKLAANIDSSVKDFSGGEKQSLSLGLKILTTPQVLLLDEHTSALDPSSSKKLLELTQRIITQKKITCIMATHNLDDALRYGNRIIALKNGQIIFNAFQEAKNKLTKEELIKLCYH